MIALRHILMVCLAGALSASGVAPVVTGLDLLDADTGALIQSLENNDTLDLTAIGQRALLVCANLSGSGSIDAANGGAFEDWDGDGVKNRAELRSGTDPVDPNSRLVIVSLQPNAGQMDIEWQSVSGKTYWVLSSTNLLSNDWKREAEGLPALGTETFSSLEMDSSGLFIKVERDE